MAKNQELQSGVYSETHNELLEEVECMHQLWYYNRNRKSELADKFNQALANLRDYEKRYEQ